MILVYFYKTAYAKRINLACATKSILVFGSRYVQNLFLFQPTKRKKNQKKVRLRLSGELGDATPDSG